jgi:hypothetical protein
MTIGPRCHMSLPAKLERHVGKTRCQNKLRGKVTGLTKFNVLDTQFCKRLNKPPTIR